MTMGILARLPDERFEDVSTAPADAKAPVECELWLRVASDVLEVGRDDAVGSTAATKGQLCAASLGDVRAQPDRVGPWERGKVGIDKDKAGGWAISLACVVAPRSERRHEEALRLELGCTPGQKGQDPSSQCTLKVYQSNVALGKHVLKRGPKPGQQDENGEPVTVVLEKRTCHRRVLFSLIWPKASPDKDGPAQVFLTIEDLGQCPSIERYEPEPGKHPCYYARRLEYRPIERKPDPNDKNPLPTESWQVKPALPDGLALCPKTGAIRGTPGSCTLPKSFVVTARNAAGEVHYQLRIEVRLGAAEERRLLERAWRLVKFPPIDLPATKKRLEDICSRQLQAASALIDKVVKHIPEKSRALKSQLQTGLPRAVEFNRELAAVASYGRRSQLVVPRDFGSLQEALHAAQYAQETPHIWVLPGQYDDPVWIQIPCVIEGTGPGAEILCVGEPCVEFRPGGEHAVLRNMTVVRSCMGYAEPGPCVKVDCGRPTIEGCRVASDHGVGIELRKGTNALVQENVVFPSYDRQFAGIRAEPGAEGRVIMNVFAAEGQDMDLPGGSKVQCERNTAEPIYGLDTPQCFEIDGLFGEEPYFTTSLVSRGRQRFFEEEGDERELSACEVSAQLHASSLSLSHPSTKQKRPPRTYPQIAVGTHLQVGAHRKVGWNERQLVTEWNPHMAFTAERRQDEVMRQSAMEPVGRATERSRGPVLRSILTAPWERKQKGLKSCMSGTIRSGPPIRVERAASTGSLYTDPSRTQERIRGSRLEPRGWSTASLATGDRFASHATGDRLGTGTNPLTGEDRSPNRFGSDWLDEHSCVSPVSTKSPLSPTRSRLNRTRSESSLHLSDAGRVRYKSTRTGGEPIQESASPNPEHRQNPKSHSTVWGHKVVWDAAPALRLPHRAPGPTTLKMRGIKAPSEAVKLDLLRI